MRQATPAPPEIRLRLLLIPRLLPRLPVIDTVYDGTGPITGNLSSGRSQMSKRALSLAAPVKPTQLFVSTITARRWLKFPPTIAVAGATRPMPAGDGQPCNYRHCR